MKNFYTDLEIEAIKKELCFNKDELKTAISNLINNSSLNDNELYKMELLFIELDDRDIKSIEPDFSKKEIHAYVIFIAEGKIEEVNATDFYFNYDNEAKEIYCASFSW